MIYYCLYESTSISFFIESCIRCHFFIVCCRKRLDILNPVMVDSNSGDERKENPENYVIPRKPINHIGNNDAEKNKQCTLYG